MQAMLLAAGFGTRLRPYTLIRPKPLFPVCTRPLIHILLDMLRRAGSDRVVVNCHHLGDQIEAALQDREDVILQPEPEILGTGGSLRRALERFDHRPVLVMNGDIFHDIDLAAVYRYHRLSGNLVTMVLHDYPRFNRVRVRGDRVIGFGKQSRTREERMLAFTGIHVLESGVMERIPSTGFYHIIDLYRDLADAGDGIGCLVVDDCYWRDIGTPGDYLDLHRELLWQTGASRLAGLAGEFCGRSAEGWCLGREVDLEPGVRLEEWGCLGDRVRVGAGARLSGCVVWDGARIEPGREYRGLIITPQTDR